MSVDWPIYKLSDIVDFKTGRLDSNAAEEKGQYPFFTCSPTTLAINTFAFDDEAVLLAGNNASGVFAVKYYKGKFNAYQRTYVITPKDRNMVSVRWLYFRIKHVTSELQQMSVGTATKFLTKKILDSYEVSLPTFNEQEENANILWSLQNKIALNRQTNQTLEHLAQAIFKSWFVDFDPVIDNAIAAGNEIPDALKARAEVRRRMGCDRKPLAEVMQKLFPDNFEYSDEIGWRPKGWHSRSSRKTEQPSHKLQASYLLPGPLRGNR